MFRRIGRLLLIPVSFLVVFFPYWFGTVYVLSLAAATGWLPGWLIPGLIGYAVLAIVTMAVLAAFSYRSDSLGLQTWRQHLAGQTWRQHATIVLCGLIWPWAWAVVAWNFSSLMEWWGIAIEPTVEIVHTWRYGVRVEMATFE